MGAPGSTVIGRRGGWAGRRRARVNGGGAGPLTDGAERGHRGRLPASDEGAAASARWRPAIAGVSLVVAAGLAAGGCSSGTLPVGVHNVITGAGAPLSGQQKSLIIAYKLGAHGRLPDTVGG